MKKESILVLMGGMSEEREVSLRSGAAVLKALQNLGYEAQGIDLQPESVKDILELRPDLVFLALHGIKGEDGTIQGLLEIMGIPYTGSGVASSAICMNKVLTKKVLQMEGIPTAPYITLQKGNITEDDELYRMLEEKFAFPMVVKAATQGSSIGTVIVRTPEALPAAIQEAFSYDQEIIVEKYIKGVELTVPVIGNREPEALPIIEITSVNEFYDYESKYTPGMCQHIIPARISEEDRRDVEEISLRAYTAMGCRGFARVDFMLDGEGHPYVLELNTIPGMTEMSLVPDSARAAGYSFEVLVDKIVRFALEK